MTFMNLGNLMMKCWHPQGREDFVHGWWKSYNIVFNISFTRRVIRVLSAITATCRWPKNLPERPLKCQFRRSGKLLISSRGWKFPANLPIINAPPSSCWGGGRGVAETEWTRACVSLCGLCCGRHANLLNRGEVWRNVRGTKIRTRGVCQFPPNWSSAAAATPLVNNNCFGWRDELDKEQKLFAWPVKLTRQFS